MIDNHAPSLAVTGPDGQTFGTGYATELAITASDPTRRGACSLWPPAKRPASIAPGPSGHSIADSPGQLTSSL